MHALTGTVTDRLPEEKRRGISIDIGFAALDLDDGDGGQLQINFIDVPGHSAFIGNMLAGAGGVDCLLLIVAADEGIREQTREHLGICRQLGISTGAVVITKCDAVNEERLLELEEDLRQFTQGSFLESSPVLRTSARTGDGIDRLRAELGLLPGRLPAPNLETVLRLPIDRAFSVRGFGTVVTGTLRAGTLAVEQKLTLLPKNLPVKVRGLQVHGRQVVQVAGPARTALNLSGIDSEGLRRGDVLVGSGLLSPTLTVDVTLEPLPACPLPAHGCKVRVHALASESVATVLHYHDDQQPTMLARLKLADPLVLLPGDPFIVRSLSPAATIAGGRVLDIAPVRGIKKKLRQAWLERLRDAGRLEQLQLRVARQGVHGISLSALTAETGLLPEIIEASVNQLSGQRLLFRTGPGGLDGERVLTAENLARARNTVLTWLSEGRPISRAELRSRAAFPDPVLGLALHGLEADGKVERRGDSIQRSGSQWGHTDQQQKQLAAVETVYRSAGLAAPLQSDVCRAVGVTAHGTPTIDHPVTARKDAGVRARRRSLHAPGGA